MTEKNGGDDDDSTVQGSRVLSTVRSPHSRALHPRPALTSKPRGTTKMSELVGKMDAMAVGSGTSSGTASGAASSAASSATAAAATSAAAAAAAAPVVDVSKLSDTELIKFLAEQEQKRLIERQRKKAEKQSGDKEHKFWNTQPVPQIKDTFEGECGPLDPNTDVSTVKAEPYNMPAGFEWCDVDVTDVAQIEEMYRLLTENYVEDDDCVFRFDYSKAFLRWALTPPGYLKEWHVGVRNQKTGSLMGCITAVPARVSIHGTSLPMVEINFLCVHKKLRTKRLAPVLIKEITRRVNTRNVWQVRSNALYDGLLPLPLPT